MKNRTERIMENFESAYKAVESRLYAWTMNLFTNHKNLDKINSVYYYTNVEALVNGIIVSNPESGKEICLWATKWSHLNDSSENKIGLRYVSKLTGNNKEVIDAFKKISEENHSISFSKKKDYLPMWTLYGANGTGVMLEFDIKELLKLYGARLMPCLYDKTNTFDEILRNLANLEYGEDFDNLSQERQEVVVIFHTCLMVSILKRNSFKYEDEIRIAAIGNHYFADKKRNAFFRVKKGIIIPYIKEYLPISCLKSIWIGPNTDQMLSRQGLEDFLKNRNLNIKIHNSRISYRG